MSTVRRGGGPRREFDSDVLRRFRFDALKLPPAGDTWLSQETGVSHPALVAFHKAGVIRKVELDDDQPTRAYWETVDGVHSYAQERFGDLDTTPCGNATGIRTIEAGETYTCTCDGCRCRMGRKTAEEVVS